MAGGGIKGGQVIGETDELGWSIAKDPVSINDFHATMLHLFGIDHLKLTKRFGGLDIRLTDLGGQVVKKLPSTIGSRWCAAASPTAPRSRRRWRA
jgi:hypothetical protein